MSTSEESARGPLPDDVLHRLRTILGPDDLLTSAADCWAYGYDNSRLQGMPQAVATARSHEQVTDIIGLCNDARIPLVARGRGTGTTGATVPDRGGIVLSLERMDRILDLDPANRLAIVQPGVTNQELQDRAAAEGLFWPPDPSSAATCTIGGNLAYNSAGPRAVKYGTPRENTLGLRAVTGGGEEIRTGTLTTKGVVGYDFTRLLIGSEGTLAVITEAVLKLTPLAESKRTLRALYRDIEAAATAVSQIMRGADTPCALEFMDGTAIAMVRDYEDLGLPVGAGAMLMIEVDGGTAAIDTAADKIATRARVDGCLAVDIATTDAEVTSLWRARKALSPALRNVAPLKINEDVAVPVSRLPELIHGLDLLARQTGIPIVNFGHAGNGNLHVNLLLDPESPAQTAAADACLSRAFDLVIGLGGTLSGEHGVGLVKRDFIDREIDPVTLRLMHDIRRQFDPHGILNPGKALPPVSTASGLAS